MGRSMNNFAEDLEQSKQVSEKEFWGDIYQNFLTSSASLKTVDEYGWHQEAGIDRVCTLENSKQILIDEKIREKDYGDVIFEYKHTNGSEGWIKKELACDYIAYNILPANVCHFLPFRSLRKIWEMASKKLKNKYDTKSARNHGYETKFIPIPIADLYKLITRVRKIDFNKTSCVYNYFFTNFKAKHELDNCSSWREKSGVTHMVVLENGQTVNVKQILDPTDNVRLEYEETGGSDLSYINHDLDCDYIVYGSDKTRMAYMLPYFELKRVFSNYSDLIRKRYDTHYDDLRGFKTNYVEIPPDELMKLMTKQLRVEY